MVKVAILPKEYPNVTLKTEDLTFLEDAIAQKIANGWKDVLQFEGIHF